ncbi:ABC transporter substrate-binding protein [Streptomyces sp. NPDC059649]|uniref:ABC transporter substrate-binding protein n=1 Tax=Streptomyces sp. NPDC059649 TaxID=3346895 RepID=UPI0036975102
MRSRRHPYRLWTAVGAAIALLTSGCAGWGGARDSEAINVLMVGNPQMEDLAKLTREHFTSDTGIKVNFTVLPENEFRDKATQEVATQAGQYDLVSAGSADAQIWAKNGWLKELDGYTAKDRGFDAADLLTPMKTSLQSHGKLYALPFYGESSFLMYRKDLFKKAGLTMPERPTWSQVARFAAKLDGAEPGTAGICLRGLPGWGEVFAPLTTVVNTFGGTWFTKDWQARVDSPEFTRATKFYVNLLRQHGEPGAAQSGFTECLNTFGQGKAAMWYDATSAAGSLEDPRTSKVAGKVGYAFAPVEKTHSSGWLWSWAWAMPRTTDKADAAWKFMSWASSKKYERLVGRELGWPRVPSGKRASTYRIPQYVAASKAFGTRTQQAIEEADPKNPGVQPRPTVGIQYVPIPEFADLGTKVSQEVGAAIAGRGTVEQALRDGQRLAEKTAAENRN